MKVAVRVGVLALSAVLWFLYVQEAQSSDRLDRWNNSWLTPAIGSIMLVVVVFVFTLNRSGTRGSIASDLGSMMTRTRIKDPVDGLAQVVSASGPPRSGQNAGRAMCTMNLVITVPGQPSVATDAASLVPLAKWPSPGVSLPVVADRSDLRRFKIDWDRVATGWDVGGQQAQALADHLNGQPNSPAPTTSSVFTKFLGTNVSATVNGQPIDPADLAPFEAMTGMDLNGDGVIGTSGNPSPAASSHVVSLSGEDAKQMLRGFLDAQPDTAHNDAVTQLERLAALRDSGAISEDEYTLAKKKLLGQ